MTRLGRLKGATPTDPRPCSRGLASPCGFASHCKCWFESGIYTPGFFLPFGSWVRSRVWALFSFVWVHGLCFLSPFLLWRRFARFLGGFVCTRTTCMISGASTGGGFHHPPALRPWVSARHYSERKSVLPKTLLNLPQTSSTQVLVDLTWWSRTVLR